MKIKKSLLLGNCLMLHRDNSDIHIKDTVEDYRFLDKIIGVINQLNSMNYKVEVYFNQKSNFFILEASINKIFQSKTFSEELISDNMVSVELIIDLLLDEHGTRR